MKRTQLEAAAHGDLTYFTGESCNHGHIGPRYTSTGGCVECVKANRRQHAQKVRDLLKKATSK